MLSAIRAIALTTMGPISLLGSACHTRADILYSRAEPVVSSISWAAVSHDDSTALPTSRTGVMSCAPLAPCVSTQSRTLQPDLPSIEIRFQENDGTDYISSFFVLSPNDLAR